MARKQKAKAKAMATVSDATQEGETEWDTRIKGFGNITAELALHRSGKLIDALREKMKELGPMPKLITVRPAWMYKRAKLAGQLRKARHDTRVAIHAKLEEQRLGKKAKQYAG